MHADHHARRDHVADAEPLPDVLPPRRPGPVERRDVIVQHHTRLAVGLFASSLAVSAIALILAVGNRDAGRAGTLAAVLFALGIGALVHTARVGWRRR